MSIDFTVVCKRSRPPEWTDDFRVAGFPFDFWLEDVEAWKAATRDWLSDTLERSELEEGVEQALMSKWSFVARFNCKPRAAELVDLCARELVARFGGFYYDDHGWELSETFPGVDGATAREVVDAWRHLADDESAREDRLHQEALREWRESATKEPEAYAEANDWSDVDF